MGLRSSDFGPPRVVLTGGGTGGHIFPALAIADALRDRAGESSPAGGAGPGAGPGGGPGQGAPRLLYIGNAEGLEATIVPGAGLDFEAVAAGAVRGRSPAGVAGSLLRIGRGFRQAIAVLRRSGAEVVLATGGYVCVPVALAARRLGIPVILYLPDRRPGWAIRFLAHFARAIAVTTEAAKDSLPPEKVVETGYPVRREILTMDRAAGQAALGLDRDRPTLLVLGGSRGARSINEAVTARLPEILARAQVIHATGPADYERIAVHRDALPVDRRERYRLAPFLTDELAAAMAAADLAISRSGASILGEYPARGLPSILVPYPHAGAHQEINADFLAAAGAAVKLPDADLDRLWPLVESLLDDPARRGAMAAAARRLARPDAAAAIARLTLKAAAEYRGRSAAR